MNRKEEIKLRFKYGDTIGLFTPSLHASAQTEEKLNIAKNYLLSKGFNILEGSLINNRDFYRSGNIQERVDEINELIRNPNVKCLMATMGGMNSNSLLPYIDYQALIDNPKIIIGFSDVTAILLSIYAKTNITTYYGPNLVTGFGINHPYSDYTYKYFEDILIKEPKFPYIIKPHSKWVNDFTTVEGVTLNDEIFKNEWVGINGGKAKGRLIGGNLDTLYGIMGTEYMPKINKGDILFIEDQKKSASDVEKSFSMLKLNKIFDKVSGIVLGKHRYFNDQKTGKKPYDILLEVIRNNNIPILAEVDCSHTNPMMTLPIGGEIEINVSEKTFYITKDWM